MPIPVVWAERPDVVLITVVGVDFTDVDVKFEKENVKFSTKIGDKEENFDLDLKSTIVPEESTFVYTGREVQIKLKKAEEGPYWNSLTKKKVSFVKVDWAKWKDEDEVEDDDLGGFGGGMPGLGGMGGMDMQQMMSQMGGMGGLGGMGGMDDLGEDEGGPLEDSDDETPADAPEEKE